MLWFKLFIKGSLIFIFVMASVVSLYPFIILDKMQHVALIRTNEALGIRAAGESGSPGEWGGVEDSVENIALFGLDIYEPESNARSDSILIFTIDYKNKKIKISSIMRDLLVPIENYGLDKINHAYSYGGPQLAVKTVNQNFGTDIKDFLAVDFLALEKAIDALGGVHIDVRKDEIPYINENIFNENNFVQKSGMQLLNGEQAVSYARVRNTGNGDFERTERQRKILSELLTTVQTRGLTFLPGYVGEIMPYVRTSMDKYRIISLGARCIKEGVSSLEMERFPVDGYWNDDVSTGIYYLTTDLNTTRKHLNDFIFRDLRTYPGA